jgi:hypothetical protein
VARRGLCSAPVATNRRGALYEDSLPDGSASIDSWRAILRAQLCRGGIASPSARRSASAEPAPGRRNRRAERGDGRVALHCSLRLEPAEPALGARDLPLCATRATHRRVVPPREDMRRRVFGYQP